MSPGCICSSQKALSLGNLLKIVQNFCHHIFCSGYDTNIITAVEVIIINVHFTFLKNILIVIQMLKVGLHPLTIDSEQAVPHSDYPADLFIVSLNTFSAGTLSHYFFSRPCQSVAKQKG